VNEDGSETILFETQQRNLFRKNADKRQESIAKIKAAIAKCM
jgi:hypothetical protein